MKLNKPKFWDTKFSFISFLLIPFSLMVIFFVFSKKKIIKSKKFNIPVICVGNLYIGGTGKTPVSIFLASELSKLNKRPAIVRKFYKNHIDEHSMIRKKFKNLVLEKNRMNGLKVAEREKYDIAILDDGFQDCSIKKDLNILCFNQNQLIGNGLVLPAGPLRESLISLKEANIILINGKKNLMFEKKLLSINSNLEIFYSKYKPKNLNQFKGKRLFALAGIGNPRNFFELLEENNLIVEKKLSYPDHYVFNDREIQNILDDAKDKNLQIIMTEKDYYKVKNFNKDQIHYLEVELEIAEKENFIKKIIKLYDQNN